jgi:hypothetical protein
MTNFTVILSAVKQKRNEVEESRGISFHVTPRVPSTWLGMT